MKTTRLEASIFRQTAAIHAAVLLLRRSAAGERHLPREFRTRDRPGFPTCNLEQILSLLRGHPELDCVMAPFPATISAFFQFERFPCGFSPLRHRSCHIHGRIAHRGGMRPCDDSATFKAESRGLLRHREIGPRRALSRHQSAPQGPAMACLPCAGGPGCCYSRCSRGRPVRAVAGHQEKVIAGPGKAPACRATQPGCGRQVDRQAVTDSLGRQFSSALAAVAPFS